MRAHSVRERLPAQTGHYYGAYNVYGAPCHLLRYIILTIQELEATIGLTEAPRPMQNGTYSPNETPVHHQRASTSIPDEERQIPAINMSAIDPALHPVTPKRRCIPQMSPERDSSPAIDPNIPNELLNVFGEDEDHGSPQESPSGHLPRRTYKAGHSARRNMRLS